MSKRTFPTDEHIRDFPRRLRNCKLDSGWSLRSAIELLADEAEVIVEMALLPPDAGAKIAADAGVSAAFANLDRALKAEARIEALERERDELLCGLVNRGDEAKRRLAALAAEEPACDCVPGHLCGLHADKRETSE